MSLNVDKHWKFLSRNMIRWIDRRSIGQCHLILPRMIVGGGDHYIRMLKALIYNRKAYIVM